MKHSCGLATVCWLMVLSVFSGVARAYEVDPATFVKLPKHCQAWFAGAARKGKVEGMRLDQTRYDVAAYENRLKGAWTYVNHYCPGLVGLVRLSSPEARLWSKYKKQREIKRVLAEIDYQLTHSRWSQNTSWFQAEVLTNKARALILNRERRQAVAALRAAISVYPPYLPAHWLLADLNARMGNHDAALATLEAAKSHARSSSHADKLQKRIEELRNKTSDRKLADSVDPEDGVNSSGTEQ